MKQQKILTYIFVCLPILIPLLSYSFVFPNIYNRSSIGDTDDADKYIQELESKMPGLLKKYQITGGIAISVITNSQIQWTGGFGYADVESSILVSDSTLFQIASMSKSYCAWAVMQLYEEGLIELDNPVDKYLTRWNLPDTGFNNSQVTIRRILSHTAGLSKASFLGYADLEAVPSLEEALTEVKVITPPGSKWMYSGGGYLVLQLLIEEVSNQTYSEYLSNEILTPLNLTDTYPDYPSEIQYNVAKPYNPFGKELPMYRFAALAAGGQYSSIHDLSKFMLANMPGNYHQAAGRGILNASTLTLMQTEVASVHPYMGGYGLGYQLKTLENNQKMVYHNGQNTGFIGTMNFIPESGEGIVILTNSDAAKSMIIELEGKWQQMIQGTAKQTLLYSKYLISIPLIVVLGSLLGGIVWYLISKEKKNRINWRLQKTPRRIITVGIFSSLLIISNILLYMPIKYRSGFSFVYWFLPNLHWVSLLLDIVLIYSILMSMLFQKPKLPHI